MGGFCASDATLPGAALGKHEELGTKSSESCTCAPKYLLLRSEHGELVKPRGKCVNKCAYCAKLAAVENCEMLSADALQGDAPALVMILGTRTATLDMEAFRDARRAVVRKIRRRWPAFEYAYQVEYSTGMGPRSGGRRRPHWNWFCKGIGEGEVDELRDLAVGEWCRLVDAEPQAQYVARIDNAVGLTKYVAQHFMKEAQAPPAGFTAQRFNCSEGYFGSITRRVARARARDALALKREVYKHANVLDGGHDVELAAQLAHRRNVATRWVLASATGSRLSESAIPKRRLAERLLDA